METTIGIQWPDNAISITVPEQAVLLEHAVFSMFLRPFALRCT